MNIIHTTSDYLPKVLRFLNVAFDSSGDCLIAGDHQGNIYVFDLSGNRWVILLIFTLLESKNKKFKIDLLENNNPPITY